MLLHILGTVEIILFAWGILQMEFVKKKGNYLWAAIILFVGELFYQTYSDEIVGFLVGRLMTYMLGTLILFIGPVTHRIIKYWFSFCYVTLFYLPIQTVVNIWCLKKYNTVNIIGRDLLVDVITCIIMVAAVICVKKRKMWTEWIQRIPVGYFILGIVCDFSVDGIRAFIRQISPYWDVPVQIFIEILQLLVCILLYGLGIAYVFANLWKQHLIQENVLKDEYLRMSKMHYEELANHMREVRSIRHDMKAHMNILDAYIGDEKWEQARAYLQEIKNHQDYLNHRQINVGNELVNAVIMDEMGRCKEDIKFECEGVLPKELVIADYDLCTIFSNLLSNSLEACRKLCESDKRIVLQIKSFQNNLIVVVENPIEWDVPLDKLGEFTSKIDNESHGHGIYNIRKAAEKYNGQVDFFKDDEKFQVKILVPQAIYE